MIRTKLGDEEEEHDDGGDEGDHAAGERAAVEVFVDFGIRVQIPELVEYAVHLLLLNHRLLICDFLSQFPGRFLICAYGRIYRNLTTDAISETPR